MTPSFPAPCHTGDIWMLPSGAPHLAMALAVEYPMGLVWPALPARSYDPLTMPAPAPKLLRPTTLSPGPQRGSLLLAAHLAGDSTLGRVDLECQILETRGPLCDSISRWRFVERQARARLGHLGDA